MFKTKPLLMIKFGGSLITNKNRANTARLQLIRDLWSRVKQLFESGDYQIIVGHGSGSFGHIPAAKFQTQHGLTNDNNSRIGAAIVKERALALHHRVLSLGVEAGLPLFSLSPGGFLQSGSPTTFLPPLLACFQFGLIPLVYGDVITDNKKGVTIYSTEKVLEIVARSLNGQFKPVYLVHLGITNGVYDQNGQTIPLINDGNLANYYPGITGSQSTDVTGGMLHKVQTALELTKMGVTTIIANGRTVDWRHLLNPSFVESQQTVIA